MSVNLIEIEDQVAAFSRPLPEHTKFILALEARRRGVPLVVVVKEGVLTVAEQIVKRAAEKRPQGDAAA